MASVPPAAVEALATAERVTVLTGAGVSAESGIPTFRDGPDGPDGPDGLWARYDPAELATPEAFARDPGLVWRWYEWRRDLVSRARPNPAHRALADLERYCPSLILITQNVDALHQAAGSRAPLQLHGNIHRNRCSREGMLIEPDAADTRVPPACPHCGARLRPDVVWFGEPLRSEVLDAAVEAARTADVFIAAGTSSLVHPAAGLAEQAGANGATIIEINPNVTPLTGRAHYVLAARAASALAALVQALSETGGG